MEKLIFFARKISVLQTFDKKEYGSTYGELYDIMNKGHTAQKARTPNILTLCRTVQKIKGIATIKILIESKGKEREYNHIGFANESSGAYSQCGFNAGGTCYVKIDSGQVCSKCSDPWIVFVSKSMTVNKFMTPFLQ